MGPASTKSQVQKSVTDRGQRRTHRHSCLEKALLALKTAVASPGHLLKKFFGRILDCIYLFISPTRLISMKFHSLIFVPVAERCLSMCVRQGLNTATNAVLRPVLSI